MSMIQRSRTTIQGDTIVQNGDLIVTNANNGIVMTDNVGDQSRVKVVDDAGTKTLEIEEIP